jgi:hypothetical protein
LTTTSRLPLPLRLPVPLLLIIALAGLACASRPVSPPGTPVPSESSVSAAEQQLAHAEVALAAVTAEAAPPDCARARLLRDNVCALSAKICDLVSREPAIADGSRRCQNGRTRCQAARTRVSARCGPEAGTGD